MSDRTALWMRNIIATKETLKESGNDLTIFAPILPLEREKQRWYLDQLVEDFRDGISGLAVYDASSLGDVDATLEALPRLALTEPTGPQELLYQISLGADLFVLPFINQATDAGIALSFVFPPPEIKGTDSSRQSLGVDTWDVQHATDLGPLQEGCQCYTCTKHHRAYLQHLLSVKEMLAWVLLQLHNHHVIDQFFKGVRVSISNGSFEADREAFEQFYEPELSEQANEGPRYVYPVYFDLASEIDPFVQVERIPGQK
jgi:queuine tRNA-ribosyltransferase subunit QTRTD1